MQNMQKSVRTAVKAAHFKWIKQLVANTEYRQWQSFTKEIMWTEISHK